MQSYKPMLAKSSPQPFSHKDWLFEVKWDGFRALAYTGSGFSLKSRNGNEFKYNFPEIAELNQFAGNVVVDGELLVMESGLPDFEAMQRRARLRNQKEIKKLAQDQPATYVIFDILEKDSRPLARAQV